MDILLLPQSVQESFPGSLLILSSNALSMLLVPDPLSATNKIDYPPLILTVSTDSRHAQDIFQTEFHITYAVSKT